MTLGQEFHGFATTLGEDHARLTETIWLLSEINIGATAIGTGITADPGYGAAAVRHLIEITGLSLETAPDLIESTSDTGAFMSFSGSLKRSAIKLSKICNDLRLLSSGPQAGLGEINLPPRQAGSSIMPGKVNPVIPEAVSQVAYAVAGTDVTVTMAAEAGQLQLNAFEPVIAHSLLQSITWMRQACWTLRVNCVDGITANVERLDAMVASSVGVITALIPFIGYTAAAALAKAGARNRAPRRRPRGRGGTHDPARRRAAARAVAALGHPPHHHGDPGDRPAGRALGVVPAAGGGSPPARDRGRAVGQITRQWVVSEPMPSIETVTVEPSRRKTCGLRE